MQIHQVPSFVDFTSQRSQRSISIFILCMILRRDWKILCVNLKYRVSEAFTFIMIQFEATIIKTIHMAYTA